METLRGRGKNKCYWKEDETQLLIEVLQNMASDPSWKTNGGFRSNYMVEVHRRIITKMPNFSKLVSPHIESKVKWLKTKFHVINDMVKQKGCQWNEVEEKIACERQWYKSYCQSHKEAKGLWEFKFPYFSQLELVYGRDRPNGVIVEANDDVIHNMEVAIVEENGKAVNIESGDENHDESHDSLSDEEEEEEEEEENGVQATPTPSNSTNARKMDIKRKTTLNIEDGIMKKTKTTSSHDNIVARLDEINSSFRDFVEGFNANFATMANLVTNTMTDGNIRQKTASEKLKNVIDEIMKFNLSSDDVFKAAEIFATNKNKIDVFFSLPEQLRVSYVIRGFNSKSATTANAKIDDTSQKLAMEKLKDVIIEIMKLNLSSDDVFKAADMFATERNRIDVFFNLPEQPRVQYVMRLTGQPSSS